jgi:spore germination protein KB
MNNAISAKQLMYSVGAFITASSLLTSNLYYFVKNDSWISVIIGFFASVIIVSVYGSLSDRYPGFSLIEINDAVFGKYAGNAVSGFYILYFLSLACFNTRDLGDFVKSSILPGTPLTVIFIIFISVCAWAVHKGPVNMTRYGMLVAVMAMFAILLNTVLLFNKTEIKNLQPAFELPIKNYLIGAHIVTMLPFCEIIAFMMFIPYMHKSVNFGRAAKGGLIIGGVLLLIIVLRDIMVLGQYNTISSMPTYSTIRLVDIGDVLTRLEIVYAVILMSLLFFKVCIVYFAAVSGFSRLFHIDSYQIFVCIFSVLIVIYAAALFVTVSEHIKWNITAAAMYSTFFILILPVLTLIVSFVRGSSKVVKTQV